MNEMNVPHWKNFIECIRTRARPVSDIETCVRSSTRASSPTSRCATRPAGLGRSELDGEAGAGEAVAEGEVPGAVEARGVDRRSVR